MVNMWWMKAAVWLTAVLAWNLAYAELNSRGVQLGVFWESPGIYKPWAVYPYVFGPIILLILPLVRNWRARRLYPMLAAYSVAIALSFAVYYFYPVVMVRIDYQGLGLADRLMRLVVSADDPANCFPSSHCMFAILGAWYVRAGGAGWSTSAACAVLAALVCLSTVLVGQHFWLDIPGGAAAAFIGISTARRWKLASADL